MARIAAILLLIPSMLAAGEGFQERLAQANELLQQGAPEEAYETYRELLVDQPESKMLYYNMGCAQYERALHAVKAQGLPKALALFEEAESCFVKAAEASESRIRQHAQYNQINAAAWKAKGGVGVWEHTEVLKAFKESVQAYEALLRRYPDHAGARHNMEHMRYALKRMLQEPTPPRKKEGGETDETDEGDGERGSSDSKQSGQGDSEEQPASKPRAQNEEQNEEQSPRQKEASRQEPDQEAGQQNECEQDKEDSEEKEPDGKEAHADAAPVEQSALNPEMRKNLEAILQSLEDMDNREVYDSKNRVHRRERVRSNWW